MKGRKVQPRCNKTLGELKAKSSVMLEEHSLRCNKTLGELKARRLDLNDEIAVWKLQ